jgi:hypothetical protein
MGLIKWIAHFFFQFSVHLDCVHRSFGNDIDYLSS